MAIALGAVLNLALQLAGLGIISVGRVFGKRTRVAFAAGKEEGQKFEKTHKNLMTSAVLLSGLGTVIWMVPNFILGWFYGSQGLGYGSGGYLSYFEFGGSIYPHWYLVLFMVVVGSLTAFLGVYLVLRMRWSRFPARLAVQNYRRVMVTTWTLWVVNVIAGLLVFYYFAYIVSG